MSYQAGVSTDPTDLLKKWRDFLVAAGWTLDVDITQSSGWLVGMSKGTKHITQRSFISENNSYLGAGGGAFGSGIALTAHSAAYATPGSGGWWNQPGAPYLYNQNPGVNVLTAIMVLPAGAIPNYWMFADATGDHVALVAFRAAGVYTYLYCGDIVKAQAWTGGVYFGASSKMFNSHVNGESGNTIASPPPASMKDSTRAFLRADVDSWVNKWVSLTQSRAPGTLTATGKTAVSNTFDTVSSDQVPLEHISYAGLASRAKSSLTQSAILLPIYWVVERDFGGNLFGGGWSLAGTIPDLFQTVGDGFVPGAQFNISTDQYILFPNFAVRKYP